MASPEPFLPRVLRTEQGTVAVELPTQATDGVPGLFRVVQAGPDWLMCPASGLQNWRNVGFPDELLTSYLHVHELTP